MFGVFDDIGRVRADSPRSRHGAKITPIAGLPSGPRPSRPCCSVRVPHGREVYLAGRRFPRSTALRGWWRRHVCRGPFLSVKLLPAPGGKPMGTRITESGIRQAVDDLRSLCSRRSSTAAEGALFDGRHEGRRPTEDVLYVRKQARPARSAQEQEHWRNSLPMPLRQPRSRTAEIPRIFRHRFTAGAIEKGDDHWVSDRSWGSALDVASPPLNPRLRRDLVWPGAPCTTPRLNRLGIRIRPLLIVDDEFYLSRLSRTLLLSRARTECP